MVRVGIMVDLDCPVPYAYRPDFHNVFNAPSNVDNSAEGLFGRALEWAQSANTQFLTLEYCA